MSSSMRVLHRMDSRYVAGQTLAADPDKHKKQMSISAILNKLTTDNFDKLSAEILDVGIVEQVTMEGLVDQIFDKAVTETGCCEMYAQLCSRLANAKGADEEAMLPTFDNPEHASTRIDFRRLLLNKCQMEFYNGIVDNSLVKAREKEHRGETEELEGDCEALSKEELEEGTTPQSAVGDATAVATALAVAEQERHARRRVLGSMQFIGQLYKCGLLKERIIHNCVRQLLVTPLGEALPCAVDVECLCELLSTVGNKLDCTTKAEYRTSMKAYFDQMRWLTNNQLLDSRIRIMVQDVLDLRDCRWQRQPKVEGPKKIVGVHQGSMRQQQAVEQRDRDGRPGSGG